MPDLYGLEDRLRDDSRLECRICWYLYDPAEGDPDAEVDQGTPFLQLPETWRCPQCDGLKNQFMPLEDS